MYFKFISNKTKFIKFLYLLLLILGTIYLFSNGVLKLYFLL